MMNTKFWKLFKTKPLEVEKEVWIDGPLGWLPLREYFYNSQFLLVVGLLRIGDKGSNKS